MGVGGISDLARATKAAAAMVKSYGMASHMHQISVAGLNPNAVYNDESNHTAEEWAIKLIKQAQEDTVKILQENKRFLLELSHHLSIFPSISGEELAKMAEKYNPETLS